MALILLVLILAILSGGLGFILPALWWIAAIVLVPAWCTRAGMTAGDAPPPRIPPTRRIRCRRAPSR